MKKILIICAACICMSCKSTNTKPTVSKDISIIVDLSDSMYLPPADDVLRLYQCQLHPEGEYGFRLRTIEDRQLTPIIIRRLPVASDRKGSHDDPQAAERSIIGFYAVIRHDLDSLYRKIRRKEPLPNSECFSSIASELRYLSQKPGRIKELIVVSDLMEHSSIANCYTAIPPEQLEKRFEAANLLPKRLDNITVRFVYEPEDRAADIRFRVVEVYRCMLEARGAEVLIQARL